MTRLRQRMLDDLRRRNYSPDTIRGYIRAVQQFAEYFGRSPEQMGAEELRRYQIHLLYERKLALGTVENNISALRFLYKKTLKRRDLAFDDLPFPKQPRTLPTVLSQDEVTRLPSADIAISVPTAVIRPSRITHAVIGTVPSVRPTPATSGFASASRNCCRSALSRGVQCAASIGTSHVAEQAPALCSPVRGQRGRAARGRSRPQLSGRSGRLTVYPAQLGTDPPASPAYPLRRARRRSVAGSHPVDLFTL